MTSVPLRDQHANPPGAELEVVRGRNLPTAPLGFPELQRPKWTPGQLGLGTGARPDIQPDEESARSRTDKTFGNHTRRNTDGDIGFLGLFSALRANLGGGNDAKSGDLVCVGALTARCVTVSDAECDVGVTCWCYGSQRSG